MRSELILIAALSVAAFVMGDVAVGCLLQAGDVESDMLALILSQIQTGNMFFLDALPPSVGSRLRVRGLAGVGALVGAARPLPQGRGAWLCPLGDAQGDGGVLGH